MKLAELGQRIEELRGVQLLREPDDGLIREDMERVFGARFVDAASNDYLDLAGSREAEAGDLPRGAGASRLVFGTHEPHLLLEREAAEWLGFDAALYFSTGYAANVGALGALLSKEDAVFSDQLNHASLIDGIRLSGARARVFAHLDLADLESQLAHASQAPARWVVAESYYSMDGDGPDLPRLATLCREYDAHLYIDEAHAVGTFGEGGRGLCAEQKVKPDVLVAAFGKAVGAQGACVLGTRELRIWLWNRARSFVFSTAPSPRVAASVRAQIVRAQSAQDERERLGERALQFRQLLAEGGAPLVPGSFGPIVSVVLGEAEHALSCADRLRSRGILAQAIRPPTVAAGQCRLRLVLRSSMSEKQVRDLATAVLQASEMVRR